MDTFRKAVAICLALLAFTHARLAPGVTFEWEMDWPIIGEFCMYTCEPGPDNEVPWYVVGATDWCCAIFPE